MENFDSLTTVDTLSIRELLTELSEDKYRDFISKLIPNCDNILGVRIPTLRKLAKHIIKNNTTDELLHYLGTNDESYFEEVMLKGLIIGNLKADINTVLAQVTHFVPQISNWSLCDSFCSELKIARQHKQKVWAFLQPYFHSNNAYDIRFAVVMALFHFIKPNNSESNDGEPDYLTLMFAQFNRISHDDYYVKMAVAWAVSICYIKCPEQTLPFLQNNQLDNDTHNKSLQKIRESRQVDKASKEKIKAMKRK